MEQLMSLQLMQASTFFSWSFESFSQGEEWDKWTNLVQECSIPRSTIVELLSIHLRAIWIWVITRPRILTHRCWPHIGRHHSLKVELMVGVTTGRKYLKGHERTNHWIWLIYTYIYIHSINIITQIDKKRGWSNSWISHFLQLSLQSQALRRLLKS